MPETSCQPPPFFPGHRNPACLPGQQEAGLLASLRHNNVVNFYGVCHSPPCIITGVCGYLCPNAGRICMWRHGMRQRLVGG